MLKMRFGWYAAVSTALAMTVVISAFHQRANFYSAMVYLAQSNFCLLVLVNLTLLIYSSFIYGLTQLCYGTLRAIEVEQLTERAWFAITETCLAMTIFREEIGAWFLVMFTALVTGKVWGWIGDGRVEFLEQQPPPNPRLFHIRLSTSLAMSFIYDIWILRYAISTVIQQARPNMMVMFLFEFAVLTTCSWRTGARYILSLAEQNIIKSQMKTRLVERRMEVTQRREDMLRQRNQANIAGEETPQHQVPLPHPDDIDEMDIEVPGWAAKGEWVLWLDLLSDMIKLGIYVAFFLMLLMFYGLPIHIMRDLFVTTRDFLKRLNALLRYRRAILEMNKYPDATQQDLAQENTCIICREEMRHWDPVNNSSAIDRVRPKKLPCGHILHLGCLRSWLERQQVCPTCRSPVTADRTRTPQARRAAGLRIQFGGPPQQPPMGQRALDNNDTHHVEVRPNDAPPPQAEGGQPRVFNIGPIRFGFGANGRQVRDLAQQFGMPQIAVNQGEDPATPTPQSQTQSSYSGDNVQSVRNLLRQAEQIVQQELQSLHLTQQELQIVHLLMSELQRLRQRRPQPQDATLNGRGQLPVSFNQATALPLPQSQQSPIPFPSQVVQLPRLPTFPPPYPNIPPLPTSPLITRHGVSGSTTAILAGSPDLPEGVVLPPGWSLMPLQRLHGTHGVSQLFTQIGNPSLSEDSVGVSQPTIASTQPAPTSLGNPEAQSVEPAPLATAMSDMTTQGPNIVPQPAQLTEGHPTMSPSPVLPNWDGSSQLFGNGPHLRRTETISQVTSQADAAENRNTTQEPSLRPEDKSDTSLAAQQDVTGQAQVGPAEKGKGKAVTIEEAGDDDTD